MFLQSVCDLSDKEMDFPALQHMHSHTSMWMLVWLSVHSAFAYANVSRLKVKHTPARLIILEHGVEVEHFLRLINGLEIKSRSISWGLWCILGIGCLEQYTEMCCGLCISDWKVVWREVLFHWVCVLCLCTPVNENCILEGHVWCWRKKKEVKIRIWNFFRVSEQKWIEIWVKFRSDSHGPTRDMETVFVLVSV